VLERKAAALERYTAAKEQAGGVERMVSGSDDFTLFLWTPESNKKPVCEYKLSEIYHNRSFRTWIYV
jgi:hypothetical protein